MSIGTPQVVGALAYSQSEDGIPEDVTIAGVTLAAGDLLYVWEQVYNTATDFGAGEITWNGEALTKAVSYNGSGTTFLGLWLYYSAAGGTGDLVLDTLGGAAGTDRLVLVAGKVSGLDASPVDVTLTKAAGASTSPNIGPTATTTLADELALASFGIVANDNVAAGTWGNGFTRDQRVGTDAGSSEPATLDTGYLILSATGTVTASKTGSSNNAYKSVVCTLKAGTSVAASRLYAITG